jgi:hypothetical protein
MWRTFHVLTRHTIRTNASGGQSITAGFSPTAWCPTHSAFGSPPGRPECRPPFRPNGAFFFSPRFERPGR